MNQNRYDETSNDNAHEPPASTSVGEYRVQRRNPHRHKQYAGPEIRRVAHRGVHQRFFAPIWNLM
jgi:hypothetical protein